MKNIKPHWKTKVWVTVNGKKCFYYLEEYEELKRQSNGGYEIKTKPQEPQNSSGRE